MSDGYLNQCADCVKQAKKLFYRDNKDKFYESRKTRYWTDREENIKKAVEWAKNNPEKRKVIRAKWREANKELANHMTKDWYPRKMGAKGSYSLEEYNLKLKDFNGLCAYCKTSPATTRDHIIPISKGGGNTIDNINPSCLRCNDSKGVKLLSDWINNKTM